MKYIKYRIKDLETATRKLNDEILCSIDREARKKNLDSVELLTWSWKYLRKGKEVKNKKIDKLLAVYDEHIHSSGLFGVWTKENGWES
jgi:hypothetical protein